MGTVEKLNGYVAILLERIVRWRDIGGRLIELLEKDQFNDLLPEVEHRQAVIDSYQDCLSRCVSELKTGEFVFDEEDVLPFLLRLAEEREDFQSLQGPLLELKKVIGETRNQEKILLRMVSNLPNGIRQRLLEVQVQKNGINAYQKNLSSPLAEFHRFERKK